MRGGAASSSTPATARATSGRTAAWPSTRFASLAKTIPRATRSGRSSPNETPRSLAIVACSARSPGVSVVPARSPKPLVTPYTVTEASSSRDRNAFRASAMRVATAASKATDSPSQATRRNAARVRSCRLPIVTVTRPTPFDLLQSQVLSRAVECRSNRSRRFANRIAGGERRPRSHRPWCLEGLAGERSRKVAPPGDTELAKGAREVHLDGLRRHEQRLRDLAVRGPERSQLCRAAFAGSECGNSL